MMCNKTMWDECKCQDAVCISTLSCCFYQIRGKRQTTHALIQSSSHEGTQPHLSLTTVHIKGLVVRMGRWIRLEGRQANRACLLIRAYCWLWSISIPLYSTNIWTTYFLNIKWEDQCSLSLGLIMDGLPPSFCASSGLSEESVRAGPSLLMFLWSAHCLNWVWSVMLSGNLCSFSRSTFSCQSCPHCSDKASWRSQLGLQLHCCFDRSYDLPRWEGVLAVGHASAVGVCH